MKVYALGSCRLIAPMQYLSRLEHLSMINKGYHWYCHGTGEILQRLAFVRDAETIPQELREMTMDLDSCPTDWELDRGPIDSDAIGLFEISTTMRHMAGDTVLHSKTMRTKNFQGAITVGDSFEQLEQDILALRDQFRGLVLGCNIALEEDCKTSHIHRNRLNTVLKDIASRHTSIGVVDPNETLNPAVDIEDNNHFLSPFVPVIALKYLAEIQKVWDESGSQATGPKTG